MTIYILILFIIFILIFSIQQLRTSKERHSSDLFPDENFKRPDNIDSAKCPQCNKVATSHEEVVKDFGLRRHAGITDAQSWCRECRRDKDGELGEKINRLDLYNENN